MFVVPRLHNNLLGWLIGLRNLNKSFRILVQSQSSLEDYSQGFADKIDPSLEVYKISGFNKFKISNYFLLYNQIVKIKPTVVIFRFELNATSILLLLNILLSRVPFVIYQQWPLYQLNIFKKTIRLILIIVLKVPIITPIYSTNNVWIGESILKKHPKYNIYFIPFAIPLPKLQTNNYSKIQKGNSIKFLTIGKFQYRKNHLEVIRTFLNNEYFMSSNSRLIIIGELSTNEHKKVYSRMLENINGHDDKFNIYMNLNHNETLEIIQSCDIFILMSDFEPASISNIEAMAGGKAIIVKSLNGTANYTLDNAGGFIVSDMGQLNLKINQFFKNQELIDDFGRLNIEIVKNNLNPNDIAGQLVKLLNL